MNEMERLEQILNRLCQGNKTKLGDRLGISQQAASAWFTNHTFNIGKLQKAFPEVSTQWLMFGTGPMLESEITMSEDEAIATLGITREQLNSLRSGSSTVPCASPQAATTVPCASPQVNNEPRPRAYDDTTPDPIYHVADGQAVDRALLNMLLAEKANLLQQLEVLRQRNLELEKQYAIEHDRLEHAEHWYREKFKK